MAELNFPDPSASPWTDDNGQTWVHDGNGWGASQNQTIRYNVVDKAASFTVDAADGNNILYSIDNRSGPIVVTIPSATEAGFKQGDVITFSQAYNSDNPITFVEGGLNNAPLPPDGKAAEMFGIYSTVSFVYQWDKWAYLYGDLKDG
jgi:hypothetical protein